MRKMSIGKKSRRKKFSVKIALIIRDSSSMLIIGKNSYVKRPSAEQVDKFYEVKSFFSIKKRILDQ